MEATPSVGLYETLVTERLHELLEQVSQDELAVDRGSLANAEAPDRVSRHLARLIARAIEVLPEERRAEQAVELAEQVVRAIESDRTKPLGFAGDVPIAPPAVLRAIVRRLPDGRPEVIDRPLTPLLDTTVLTNARGEPAVGHEVRAEIGSTDSIDLLMAFIRWSGVRNLVDQLRRHCQAGKRLRILTSTYTNSTEQRALDELVALGADVRISYDTSMTRLHAKAWLFHRATSFSTAYIGSSNLTQSAQVTGLEWNVRLSEAQNPDAIAKMAAVFESYWASRDFVPYDSDQFRELTAIEPPGSDGILPPLEIVLKPFQEEMLERLALARHRGWHRNLLVAATGTGKTVMAAVDYARIRSELLRDRLLFVAHREEILDQSRNTFRYALRDAAFGEKWVGRDRPSRFDYVFASIQSLNASGVDRIDPTHFDYVVVDEFHHAAAPSYESLLERVQPRELLGLTATPERADGLDVLHYFDGRTAAELRLWDAIDQHYLAPFDYFGVHDGTDLSQVPWRRGRGYDIELLTNLLTADHVWARRVLEQVRQKIADPQRMRALGFCVSIEHARFMAARFNEAGVPAIAIWGESPAEGRRGALRDLDAGETKIVFTVDLFNEGVDVPTVDTLLLLRPTDSATLFLQQLGRGLRKAPGKSVCTVLDFVGNQRKEFRYDRRLRALLGGSRKDIERQIDQGFPFLPSGCSLELDPVARDIVLKSVKDALPTKWAEKCAELRELGSVSLETYLEETGLDLDDVYSGQHTWLEMRRDTGFVTTAGGPDERALSRAVGRLAHVDDEGRIAAYRSFAQADRPPIVDAMSEGDRRYLRMLVASLTTLPKGSLQEAVDHLWSHAEVLGEVRELLDVLDKRVNHLTAPLAFGVDVPIQAHARYTRIEIFAGFGIGAEARPVTWQSGVWYAKESDADLFAFTLDKSVGGFSPTTRYRDYAISRDLIHWESQSATSVDSETGQRYINHEALHSKIVLFARLRTDDRAFWCLGTARYKSHEGDRPIGFVWQLDQPLPSDLYTAFAAAVA
jgi:superfamily II DNA or RNA helicase